MSQLYNDYLREHMANLLDSYGYSGAGFALSDKIHVRRKIEETKR